MSLTALLTLSAAQTAVKLMIGVVALGRSDGLSLDFAGKALALVKDGASLDEAIRKLDMIDTAARLAQQTKSVADAWAQSPEHRALADAAIADFREALPYCLPDAADFVGKSLDAPAIQSLMLARLRADDCPLRSSFVTGSTSTLFFVHVTTPILSELAASPEFVGKLTPALWRDLFLRLGAIKVDTQEIKEMAAAISIDTAAILEELRQAHPSLSEGPKVTEAMIPYDAISKIEVGKFGDHDLIQMKEICRKMIRENVDRIAIFEMTKRAPLYIIRKELIPQKWINSEGGEMVADYVYEHPNNVRNFEIVPPSVSLAEAVEVMRQSRVADLFVTAKGRRVATQGWLPEDRIPSDLWLT